MYTFREKRDKIVGHVLDDYLARGWYRMGNTIFTCQFLLQKSDLFSATWIRMDLTNFKFGKSNRKLLSKNKKLFTYQIGKADITPEKDELYKKYKNNFDGYISDDLAGSLFDGSEVVVFDTWNIEVYDGDKLIALSYFDKGKESLASILGIYDPDYSKFSLGYYTLLLEVMEAHRLEMTFFYPGYIVHNNPRFDYKTKIGVVTYFDFVDKEWLNEDVFYEKEILVEKLMDRLFNLHAYLKLANIPNSIYLYPFYEASMFYFEKDGYLDHPVYLEVESENDEDGKLLVVFDLISDKYKVYKCKKLIDIDETAALLNFTFQNIIMKECCVFESKSVLEMTNFIDSLF